MRFELAEEEAIARSSATICRIAAEGTHWRVLVETWEEGGEYRGRLIFEPEGVGQFFEVRQGPPMLHGQSREEVLAAAHELPEQRLRVLLHSLA